jgi:hypothetical protein
MKTSKHMCGFATPNLAVAFTPQLERLAELLSDSSLRVASRFASLRSRPLSIDTQLQAADQHCAAWPGASSSPKVITRATDEPVKPKRHGSALKSEALGALRYSTLTMKHLSREELGMTDHTGKSNATGAPASRPERFAITFEASTGTVIGCESVDTAGRRHKLSKSEKIDLGRDSTGPSLEALLENAFEAGIACVLGDDKETSPTEHETKDDEILRRILLKPLIEESSAAPLIRKEVLRQAIVQTLIEDVIKSAESEGETRPD